MTAPPGVPDSSCYCWADASLTKGVNKVGQHNEHGDWEKAPPGSLHEGSWPDWKLKDNLGVFGWVNAFGGDSPQGYKQSASPFQKTGDAAKRSHPWCVVYHVIDKRLKS